MASGAPQEARIGYLLKAFPVVSETFILNELRAMEDHEVPLVVFSLKRPSGRVPHAALAEVRSRVLYAPFVRGTGRLLASHARLVARHPRRYWESFRRHVFASLLGFMRHPVTRRSQLRKRIRRFAWAGWVATEAKRRGVRHLHAHYAGEPLRVARLVRRMSGLQYSFTAHAKDLFVERPDRLRRRARHARFAVTCHTAGEEYLKSVLPDRRADHVLHVRHGLDTRLFRPATEPRDPGLVLAVGRLTRKKGFDTLLRAVADLARSGQELRCRIIGEGALRSELGALAEELAIADRVEIRPFVAHEELPALYRRAAVFVMPSVRLADGNRDGLPNALQEAMACGAPIVATTTGGIPEAIENGVHGLLVEPRDPRALAAAVERLLADPSLAAEMGARAARRAAAQDFRRLNRPLARRWHRILSKPVTRALTRADHAAWRRRGVASKAGKRLGIEPRRRRDVEKAIRDAVAPGVAANAWRPDLEHLATRRLWDELYKAKRAPHIQAALNGSGELPGKMLDLGCGRGGLAVALKAKGADVVALDLRFRNCAVTGWRARRYDLEIPAVTSVGERLPFADGSFDAVCCLEVLEHVRDPVRLLSEIRRVLSPRGACAITVINRWSHYDPHYHLWGLCFLPRALANGYIDLRRRTKRSYRDCQTLDEMHYYSYRGFERLARELGFGIEDPGRPEAGLPRLLHGLGRTVSLGFNTAFLVLRPLGEEASQPQAVPSPVSAH